MPSDLRERLMAQAAELIGRSMEGTFDKYAATVAEAVERIGELEQRAGRSPTSWEEFMRRPFMGAPLWVAIADRFNAREKDALYKAFTGDEPF